MNFIFLNLQHLPWAISFVLLVAGIYFVRQFCLPSRRLNLEAYITEHGDARVKQHYKTQNGFALGAWLSNQRTNKNKGQLPQERITRLEALTGWVWDPNIQQWEEGFNALVAYIAEHGDARVVGLHKTQDGVALGWWVSTQRKVYKKGQLLQERITRLEALTGWVWDPNIQQWEEGFSALEAYIAEHADARVKQHYKTQDGFSLGKWVSIQRTAYKKGQLSQERIARLEALAGWAWSAKE